MNNNLEIRYDQLAIENYVSEILTLGICKLFLPVTFIKEDKEITGIYRAEGFRPLSAIKEISTEDILSTIISLLLGMGDGENHYLFFDEYDINPETVFVDSGYSAVKMIYIPSKEEQTGPEKVLGLLQELRSKGFEEGIGYVDSAIDFIKNNSFSHRAIIHHLEMLRKEVYLCSIE